MNNDVCDNQIVNMQFSDKSTATLNMIAYSKATCTRKTLIYGTRGEIEWDDYKLPNKIQVTDFLTQKTTIIDCKDVIPSSVNSKQSDLEKQLLRGHGGSDYWLMQTFMEAVLKNDKKLVLTDVEDSFRSHLIVFAAEHSRLQNRVIDIEQFCRENNLSL